MELFISNPITVSLLCGSAVIGAMAIVSLVVAKEMTEAHTKVVAMATNKK